MLHRMSDSHDFRMVLDIERRLDNGLQAHLCVAKSSGNRAKHARLVIHQQAHVIGGNRLLQRAEFLLAVAGAKIPAGIIGLDAACSFNDICRHR